MAVDLADLVDPLRASLSAPGEDLFPGAREEDWTLRLTNAFWEARLGGFFEGYKEVDGVITPIATAGEDLSREQQQLIVRWAKLDALRAKVLALPTGVRAKAGPVESETQRSAQVLVQLLKDTAAELAQVRDTLLSTRNYGRATFLDGVLVRTSQVVESTGWVR
jgi:hypothetical protein